MRWKWLNQWINLGGYDLTPEQYADVRGAWLRICEIYEIGPRTPIPDYARHALATAVGYIIGRYSVEYAGRMWEQQQEALRQNWAAVQGVLIAAAEDERSERYMARKAGLNRETVRRLLTKQPKYSGKPNPALSRARIQELKAHGHPTEGSL